MHAAPWRFFFRVFKSPSKKEDLITGKKFKKKSEFKECSKLIGTLLLPKRARVYITLI